MVLYHGAPHYEHQTLQSTQPYIFITTDSSVGINGAVTLKKTTKSQSTIDSWSYICLYQKHIFTIDDIALLNSAYRNDVQDFVKIEDAEEILALQPCLVRDPLYILDPEANTHNVIQR